MFKLCENYFEEPFVVRNSMVTGATVAPVGASQLLVPYFFTTGFCGSRAGIFWKIFPRCLILGRGLLSFLIGWIDWLGHAVF